MIQRIQTLFLLISLGLLISMFFFPFAELKDIQDKILSWDIIGVKAIAAKTYLLFTIHLLIIVATAVIVIIISLLKYRKRILQIRLCIFNILLLIGFYGMMFYLVNNVKTQFFATIHYAVPVLFPVFSVILLFLSIKGINRDINLLRSYDRIR